MMASVIRALLVLLFAGVSAYAADITVGDSSGWNQGVNYDTWASGNTFKVGDTLVFQYTSLHNVQEVSKSDYSSCSSSNSIKSYSDGNTKIPLTATGTRYFICGSAGHCSSGMKVAITVVSGSSGSPPSTPGGSTTPSNPSPSTPSGTPAEKKNGATSGNFNGVNALLLGVLIMGLVALMG